MASYPPPPGVPPVPPPAPPPGYDPREQRRYFREQARAQRAAWRAQRDQFRYQMRSMRRGSVLGPVLLIAVGVVFLLIQTGHLDHSRFWEWYGHWWPLVLVCAGAVVLAEWAIDQAAMRDPQHPAYRRSVGSGVVFLLVLFAFGGLIANHNLGFPSGYSKMFPGFHFDQNSFDELFGDKHESDQTLDAAFPTGGSLTVDNPRGDVTISGTSDDSRIHVAVHKQIYSRSDSEADSKGEQFSPAIVNDGNAITIRMPALDGARGDLVITAPAFATVTINANRGDIHVASIKAPVTTTANHGDIDLSAITGAATAHINNGGSSISAHSIAGSLAIQGHGEDVTLSDITGPVTVTGEYFGTTHAEHIAGSFHFHTSRTDFQLVRLDGELEISPDMNLSADQAMGPVVLTTRDRNITLDRVAGDISVTNRDGSINLTAAPALGNITLEDRDGSVHATLPEQANFVMQANTNDGSIDTDFALTTQSSDNGRSLSGTVGSGGPVMHITTTNGDISVRKGEVQPLPPTPPAPPKITLTPPAAPKAPAAPKPPKAAKAPAAPAAPTN
jgi:DUF4097 and DUF4098 domain-containing protein YvlB